MEARPEGVLVQHHGAAGFCNLRALINSSKWRLSSIELQKHKLCVQWSLVLIGVRVCWEGRELIHIYGLSSLNPWSHTGVREKDLFGPWRHFIVGEVVFYFRVELAEMVTRKINLQAVGVCLGVSERQELLQHALEHGFADNNLILWPDACCHFACRLTSAQGMTYMCIYIAI